MWRTRYSTLAAIMIPSVEPVISLNSDTNGMSRKPESWETCHSSVNSASPSERRCGTVR